MKQIKKNKVILDLLPKVKEKDNRKLEGVVRPEKIFMKGR